MKPSLLVSALALAVAAFTGSAEAQTGRPSAVEVKSSSDTPQAVVADKELGSYARYLMLNGETRDEALAAARNIDHPAVPNRVLARGRAAADATSPLRQ